MVDALAVIRRLHQHRNWTNERLVIAARQLGFEALHRTFAIGQGSVWNTLMHLYVAEYVWLECLEGKEQPIVPEEILDRSPAGDGGASPRLSLDEFELRWHGLRYRWQSHLERLDPESLGEMVSKVNSSTQQSSLTSRLDVLLHVCTHAQYTTAQLVNMLRHLGISDLPETMLITMARQASK